jgi:hypothetical protein
MNEIEEMQQRIIIVSALIVIFFLLLLQCMNFIRSPESAKQVFESFTSAGPTRPGDCLCLPGYVPSNTKAKGMAGQVINQTGRPELYFLPSGTKIANWIPSCNMQGIDLNFCSNYRVLSKVEFDSIVDSIGPTLTTNLWNEIHKTTITSTFFCQKLTDPADVKSCTVLSK